MRKSNSVYILGIFLLSPIISLIIALKQPKEFYSYNIIWIFTAFFGLTFAFNPDEGSDIVRYLEDFNSWKLEGRNFIYLVSNSYTSDGYKDLFFPFISLFFAKIGFSDILFLGVLGFIFGFFYSRVYKLLINEVNFDINFFLFILLATFLLINPIWRGINGIRFSLGAIVFVYLILKNYKNGFSLLNFITIGSLFLIHFSLLLPIIIFYLFYFINKKVNINLLFVMYVSSFFFNAINLDVLNQSLQNYVPEFLLSKVDDYSRESYIDELEVVVAQTNWYAAIFTKTLFYSTSVMLVFIFTRFNQILSLDYRYKFLIQFTFALSIFVNITGFIPSFSRMQLISNTLILFLFIVVILKLSIKKIQILQLKILLIPLLLIYCIVQFRIGFDFLSTETIIGNPIVALFEFEKIPLIDLIK